MKTWKDYGSVSIEVDDTEYEVVVTGLFSKSIEGQDADGNRGEEMTFLECIKVEKVTPSPAPDILYKITKEIYRQEVNDISWYGEEL